MSSTITLEEARRAAHDTRLRTDSEYRMSFERWCADRKAAAERRRELARERLKNRTEKVWCFDGLPLVRVYMRGPKWRKVFDVRLMPWSEIDPRSEAYTWSKKSVLVHSLEADVRELVLEEVRPGVFAEWADARERIGL